MKMNSGIRTKDLDNSTTLESVKNWVMREFGNAVSNVKFYSPDGTELSFQSRFKNIFHLPFFQMRCHLRGAHGASPVNRPYGVGKVDIPTNTDHESQSCVGYPDPKWTSSWESF